MTRDYTYKIYETLLNSIIHSGYQCLPYADFVTHKYAQSSKQFVLRHDVDRKPENAVKIAEIEKRKGVKGTYYWRVVSESYNETCIKNVVDMGHELGFHYEDLTLTNGNSDKAIKLFEQNLEKFRKFYPVNTICMHGSPLTKWDNREIWKKFDYKKYGIIAEPYFDTDFSKIFYVTDTGRHWNKESVSVRDKVNTGFNIPMENTEHFIQLLRMKSFPNQMMMNIHPHRWNDNFLQWTRELVFQNIKNLIKFGMVKLKPYQ